MKALEEIKEVQRPAVPEYLPARMLNEFVYCPRLFFYEWVDGVFKDNVFTLEGRAQHKRVDKKETPLPSPEELAAESMRSRSVTLSSDRYGVIARMDLVEVDNGRVTPVDYKHGSPVKSKDGLELWPADRIQLAVQGLILRDNGYLCDEGLVYYFQTKQRIRVPINDQLLTETLGTILDARAVAAAGIIPPPWMLRQNARGAPWWAFVCPMKRPGLQRVQLGRNKVSLLFLIGRVAQGRGRVWCAGWYRRVTICGRFISIRTV